MCIRIHKFLHCIDATDISFGWILCYLCIDIHNINDCRWRQSRCYCGIDFCHWVLVDFRIVRCCRIEFVPSYLSFRSIALIDTVLWILSVAQKVQTRCYDIKYTSKHRKTTCRDLKIMFNLCSCTYSIMQNVK